MGLFLQIIRKVTASVENIWTLPSHIQMVIVDAYVQALGYTYRSFFLPYLTCGPLNGYARQK